MMFSTEDKTSKLVAFNAMLFWTLLSIFFAPVASFHWNLPKVGCDENHILEDGHSYNFTNRGYPNYATSNCKWHFMSPQNTVIRLFCDAIKPVPADKWQCQLKSTHQFIVALSRTFDRSVDYCGQGIDGVSFFNFMMVEMVVRKPARFNCVLNVLPARRMKPIEYPYTPIPGQCHCGWEPKDDTEAEEDETSREKFIFTAAIAKRGNPLRIRGGASIVSARYAMTSAHAVNGINHTDYLLLVGVDNVSDARDENEISIEKFIVHENYVEQNSLNDIALVKTLTPIKFTEFVGPICLPFHLPFGLITNRPIYNLNHTGSTYKLLGWGFTNITGSNSQALLALRGSALSNYACQENFPNNQISEENVCTKSLSGNACSTDSGGPVVWFDNVFSFRYILVGIMSGGFNCGPDTPSVHTNVYSFKRWINGKADGTCNRLF